MKLFVITFLLISFIQTHSVLGTRGDLTYYHPSAGTSACGSNHGDGELVVAISWRIFGNEPNPNNSASCKKCVRIKIPSGGYFKAKVVDKCGGCQSNDIDGSPAVFRHIAPLSVGRIKVDWEFVNCNSASRMESSNPKPMNEPKSVGSGANSVRGYYSWTWVGSKGVASATTSVAFSGWVNVDNALRDSQQVYNTLRGDKYISFGGGNANGAFSKNGLNGINDAITKGRLSGYNGIVYDVEEGEKGLANDFEVSFRKAKAAGFKVIVTISHSAPYGIGDSNTLMNSFLRSNSIDYISPQLYTTGKENSNDYAITNGYDWKNYVSSKPKVIVSIVRESLYSDAARYFSGKGIETFGFIQWEQ